MTLSLKGQLVIPATLRRLLEIGPGSRLSLTLRGKGVHMAVEPGRKTSSAAEVIGCSGYRGRGFQSRRWIPPLSPAGPEPWRCRRSTPTCSSGSYAELLSFDRALIVQAERLQLRPAVQAP